MSKFKVGDEVEAVSESFTWGYVKVGDLGVVTDKYEEQLIVDFPNQSLWYCHEKDLKLVKDKWSIYNNTLPWSQLSDKQKGKLLLAAHAKIRFTCNKLDVFGDVAFNNKGGIYNAQYIELVKPEPTMSELFKKDWNDLLCVDGKFEQQMIAKGWTKPC
jgi:hypothetical protein